MTFSVYLHIQKYYKNQSSNWPAADERYDVIADEVIILGQENFSSLTLTRTSTILLNYSCIITLRLLLWKI